MQPGEYDWTVHVRRRCGLFVKLLWPLVLTATVFCLLVVRPTRQSSNVPVHYFCCSSRLCTSVLITSIGPLTNRCYLCWCRGRCIFSSDNWRQDWVISWPWVSEWVRFYVPPRNNWSFRRRSPKPVSCLGVEKLNLTQQKHAFTKQKKCTATQTQS